MRAVAQLWACNGGAVAAAAASQPPLLGWLPAAWPAAHFLAAQSAAAAAAGPHGAVRPYMAAAAADARTQAAPLGLPPAAAAATAANSRRQQTGAPAPPGQQCLLDRNLLVDTLDMMKRLEGIGLAREQAEGLTHYLTSVMCTNREKLEELFVAKVTLEKSILEQDALHAGFRSEVLKSQELQVATFTRDTERLQINLEKIRSEIRYEVDKLTASQRLDLNLEKGRMRDELQMVRDKSNELEIKMDKEVNSLKAAMEQSKNDTVKYVLGLMLALLTAGLGAARLVLH
ncbi:hypothetical protein D9Q98_010201 [Chlorella vulgaris]|uniref:Mitochondrial calcium uniporter regulator 1 n=1 Tax=Chlorella vulgaris TaxID=3077 RepID=A0A9D4TNA6_CHLVU|nr:hypothetical protein D9Q98_010201 [Chlorella vulgaris]